MAEIDRDSTFSPTPSQRRALAALAAGKSKSEAAAVAKISGRTLDRWLAIPEFRRLLDRAGDEALSLAARQLLGKVEDAAATLVDIAADKDAAAGVRVRAASQIITMAIALWDARLIAERVSRLEDEVL